MRRKMLCGVIALPLAGISALALFWHQEELTYAYLPDHSSVPFILLIFALFFLSYASWLIWRKKKWDSSALATAVLFSVFFAVSAMISADPRDFNGFSDISVLLRFFGFFPLCYMTVDLCYFWMDHREERRRSVQTQRTQSGSRSQWLLRFLFFSILLVIWIPYFIKLFPGSLLYDTATAILTDYGVMDHHNNPWMLVRLYGWVIRIGDWLGSANTALFVFSLLQALFFAFCISELLFLLWRKGYSLPLLGILILTYGIIPTFSAYAFGMGKDSSFALCLLWLGTAMMKIREENSKQSKWNWLLFVFCCVLTPLTRNGVWILILFLLIVLFKQIKGKRVLLTLTALLVLLTNTAVPWLMNNTVSVKENLSVPMQQVARTLVIHKEEISKEEKTRYKKIMELKYWRKYKSGISDPVKKHFDAEPTDEYLREFWKLWAVEFIRHPRTYLGAAVLMNYAYYVPLADRSDLKDKLFLGLPDSQIEILEQNTTLTKNENSGLDQVKEFLNTLDQIPVIRLLTRIGLYSWMLIVVFIYCIGRRKMTWAWMLLLLPMTVLIGCCFSPVNGYYRYAFPMIITTPLFSLAAVTFSSRRE